MGLFLSMSGIIGKSEYEVEKCLRSYAEKKSGGLEIEELEHLDDNFCVINENQNSTTIFYPYALMEWDDVSIYISSELQCPVFSFHIHDGDLWMYLLYNKGVLVDQFNPIPDYWDDNLSKENIDEQKGNAKLISELIPDVKIEDINKYLVRWNLEDDESKAYQDDEFENIDWQIVDFMKKIGLEYPIDDSDKPKGKVYRLWTKELKKSNLEQKQTISESSINKGVWWKFWA